MSNGENGKTNTIKQYQFSGTFSPTFYGGKIMKKIFDSLRKKITHSAKTILLFAFMFLLAWVTLSFLTNFVTDLWRCIGIGSLATLAPITISTFFVPKKSVIIHLCLVFIIAFAITLRVQMIKRSKNKDIMGAERTGKPSDFIDQPHVHKVDERHLENAENMGLVLARYGHILYYDTSTTNVLCIGSTRSGKTQYFILQTIHNIIHSKDKQHLVINDPKGEIFANTYNSLKKQGYTVHTLNLRDTNMSELWNAFQNIIDDYVEMRKSNSDDLSRINTKIATLTLLFTYNDKSDPIWPQSAQSLFKAIILLLLEIGYDNSELDKLNLYSLYTFFIEFVGHEEKWKTTPGDANFTTHKALTELFEALPAGSAAKNAYGTVKLASGEMLTSILATLSSNISLFGEDVGIQKVTSGNEINLKELLSDDKPCAIFLIVPDDNPSRHSLASLFVTQCYEVLVDHTANYKLCPERKLKKRVNFILDEFGNMPVIPNFGNIITVCLGRNILFYLAVQSLSQIETKYGQSAATITSNCGNIVYVYTNDQGTNEHMSNMLGQMTGEYETYNGALTAFMFEQRHQNYTGRAIKTAAELGRMDTGYLLVKPQRMYGFITKFEPFYKKHLPEKSVEAIYPERHIILKDTLFNLWYGWNIFFKRKLKLDYNSTEDTIADEIINVKKELGLPFKRKLIPADTIIIYVLTIKDIYSEITPERAKKKLIILDGKYNKIIETTINDIMLSEDENVSQCNEIKKIISRYTDLIFFNRQAVSLVAALILNEVTESQNIVSIFDDNRVYEYSNPRNLTVDNICKRFNANPDNDIEAAQALLAFTFAMNDMPDEANKCPAITANDDESENGEEFAAPRDFVPTDLQNSADEDSDPPASPKANRVIPKSNITVNNIDVLLYLIATKTENEIYNLIEVGSEVQAINLIYTTAKRLDTITPDESNLLVKYITKTIRERRINTNENKK